MFMRHPSCVGAKSRGNKQNWEARAGMVKTTVKTVGQIVARRLAKSLMPLPRTQLKYGGGRNQTAKENFNLLHGNYLMEPAAGIEPATFALRKHCSTAELRWLPTFPTVPADGRGVKFRAAKTPKNLTPPALRGQRAAQFPTPKFAGRNRQPMRRQPPNRTRPAPYGQWRAPPRAVLAFPGFRLGPFLPPTPASASSKCLVAFNCCSASSQ